jgi:molybdenum cofactor cytidylyltransferase
VAVLLGDQPDVTGSVIDEVVAEWRRAPAPIVLASYRGREGHPLVFSRTLFEVLVGLRGDKAAWKIVDQHRDQVRPVELDQPHPRDVNTWAEYVNLRSVPR